ncbi:MULTISPECIES: ABC transporter permease [Paenibacillus]|uniref:ABC transporter permease subunit n=2 Tax=Paenibacillus TaxID=44249 RepID=A0ABX1ZSM1_9BACL|nr:MULTISPECIES: ABC transporter permease subunit [Paenibacillus]MBP1964889.1 putative aldouronate transport system permease protein [Paenibacillus aceris]NHW38134.1 sugar ABC transporter permease [Paenibacillus aceris]NOV02801.1 ABC transporter permease subunit [Paenibacillus planticolens]
MLKREWKHFRRNQELFFMSLPAILYKLIFNYLPMLGLVIAFKQYRYDLGIWGSEWIGLKNFEFFFKSDNAFTVTRNTILYNMSFILLTLVFALTFAILLNEIPRKWIKLHQTTLFLPYFLSWVVVGYIVFGFLDHKNGFMNVMLQSLGDQPIKWYEQAKYWPFIIILTQIWKGVGFSTLIYYAGILSIDSSYYEAAKIDGASKWQMIRKITIPLLTPLIVILLIVAIGNIFRADFGLFYFIPNDTSFLYNATDVIDTFVYRSLRVVGDVGMSTAIGLYQSVVGFILVLLSNWIIKKINSDNALW